MQWSMWGRALKIIPRVSKEQWDELDLVSRWLIATRAAVLVMTALSAAVGGMLAARDSPMFSWARLIACLLGLLFAHATNNLLNDLTDHWKGVDRGNYFRTQYGPQPLEHGLMNIRQMLVYIGITGGIALGIGGWLVYETGWVTLGLLLAGAFFVLFYTWPLKHIGLGEPAVLLVWGPLMVAGTSWVVGGVWNWSHVWVSIAYAFGPTMVLFGKHTDKLTDDLAKKIHTLPVILGEKNSRYAVIGMTWGQMALTLALIATGTLHWPMLVVLLAIPSAITGTRVYAQPRPTTKPDNFPAEGWPTYLAAHAFVYNRRFGTLFLLGLIIELIVR